MLIQMDENSATLTPFGSLVRINPVKPGPVKSGTARLRVVLTLFFRWLGLART